MSKSGSLTLKLMEMSGKVIVVMNKKLLVGENIIPIQNDKNIQPGLYNLQVLTDDGFLNNQMVLIAK